MQFGVWAALLLLGIWKCQEKSKKTIFLHDDVMLLALFAGSDRRMKGQGDRWEDEIFMRSSCWRKYGKQGSGAVKEKLANHSRMRPDSWNSAAVLRVKYLLTILFEDELSCFESQLQTQCLMTLSLWTSRISGSFFGLQKLIQMFWPLLASRMSGPSWTVWQLVRVSAAIMVIFCSPV